MATEPDGISVSLRNGNAIIKSRGPGPITVIRRRLGWRFWYGGPWVVATFVIDKEVMVGSLLITGVTLIDGSGTEPVRGAAVLTDGERIRYAGPADGVQDARVGRVIDASGKFVVPGLI